MGRRSLPAGLLLVFLATFTPHSEASGVRVTVELPIPPKIETQNIRKILVARFISSDHPDIDPGREMVSLMRRLLTRGTPFQVLEVDPPNLPEQSIEELLKNATFWRHIAEDNGADLVVSGRIEFTTRDRSGFVQEDVVSPITGQKVRRTRFAEREEFELAANLWFFKGANGALLHEDSFKGKQIYEGKMNDALQVFFELTESLGAEILGVLVPQKRHDPRTIFTD